MSRHRLFAAASASVVLFAAGSAVADSIAYTAPNLISVAGSSSVTLNGSTFVNQGLVGTARLPATLHDFNGETLGSFSGMAIDLKTWRRNADGSYGATMYTLPDRGPNNVGGFTTTNFAARLNRFSLVLNPYTGTANVASGTQQMQLTQSGGFLLRDTLGQVFTGRDPQSGVVNRGGVFYPTPPASDAGAGKIAIDAESVSFLPDGSFYVGDEYSAGIFYFDATGRQIGGIQATPAMLARVNGAVNFNGTNDAPLVAGSTGRRSNQGMEGLSVTPDGTRLIAVLQSATLQDNPTNTAVRRNNTRVMVYDISTNKTPTAPIAEYVLQLPVYNNSATGTGAATATAAQSEVLALNNTQFLVLSRDGNGRGTNGNANAIAFKSVLLVDMAGATNIAGTGFSNGTTPISTTAAANGSGALVPGITPVQQVELVNMLNTTQLARFGVNTTTTPSTQYSLSEKWEAMGLAPTLEEDKPQDFFLLIGNDNDFVSSDVDAAGVTNASTSLVSPTAGTGDNDNVVNVYRLTLPTYIDPQALAWLQGAGPLAISGARLVGAQMGAGPSLAAQQTIGMVRRARYAGIDVSGMRGWAQGSLERFNVPVGAGQTDGGGLSAGIEAGNAKIRYGVALGAAFATGEEGSPLDISGHSYGGGVYGGVFADSGLYAQAAVNAGSLKLKLRRPASYGQIARGEADGRVYSGDVEVGYAAAVGDLRIGPFVDVLYSDVKVDGYTERGASVGNGRIPEGRYKRTEGSVGFEFSSKTSIRPSLRLAYTMVDEGGDTSSLLTLAAVAGSAQTIGLPTSSKSFISGQLAVEGQAYGFGWRAAVDARDTPQQTSGRIIIGFSKAF